MRRRQFLRRGGGAALAFSGLGRFAPAFADGRTRVGLIGAGWYGKSALFRLLQIAPVEVVSLCDVDSIMLDDAASRVAARQVSRKRPRTYGDYRRMLAERDLDVVLVATPDHWHALAMIEAVRAGADVYVEKPISVDVAEGQAMVAAARRHGRVVQVNLQRRSTPHLLEARDEIVRAGRLGRVGLVELYSHMPNELDRGPKDIPPPATLDWEMWTGPAPMRPFNTAVHPLGWRAFMAYGNGLLGDLCVHMLDMTRWMLDLGAPRRISSAGMRLDPHAKADITDAQTATFDFGDLQVVWQHRTFGPPPDPSYAWGATFYGEKAILKASTMRYDFLPNDGGKARGRGALYELDRFPEDRTEEGLEQHSASALRAHLADFLDCARTRRRPRADIEEGCVSTAACILANLSMKLGRTLEWDAAAGCVRGDDEANALLRRPYRAPWPHPAEGAEGVRS
jgi:predicted dehydrogenase